MFLKYDLRKHKLFIFVSESVDLICVTIAPAAEKARSESMLVGRTVFKLDF